MSPQSNEQPLVSDAKVKRAGTALKAIADPYRLRILALLKQHKGEISVEELVEQFDIEQSTVTYHLNKLRVAGLVDSHKVRRKVYYTIVPERLTELSTLIRELTPGGKGKKSA
jgi:ArsR family transcriptional regulator